MSVPSQQDSRSDVLPQSSEGLVSVVIIFLNAQRFIDEAIESVFAQTYDRWELLLVDDGSTDASSDIARRWAAEHPERVRYLHHPSRENRGMSASRNHGVAHSRGEFIALLDADDLYLPNKLEHQVALLKAHPQVDMIYGATELWHSWNDARGSGIGDRPQRRGLKPGTIYPPGALLRPIIRDLARTPCTCGVVMKKSAIEAAGGFETSFRGMYEDQVFFLKMALTSRILVDGECLDRYRQHPQSFCNVERSAGRFGLETELVDDRRQFLEWLESFLRQDAVSDRTLHRRIRRELLPYRFPAVRPLWRMFAPVRRARTRWNRRRRHARSVGGETQEHRLTPATAEQARRRK